MTIKSSEQRKEILQNLLTLIDKKLPEKQAKLLHPFVEQFYANVSLEDLISRDILDLFGATLSVWNLMYQKLPSEAKIHVYNPHFEQNGWQSTHTIIEVATEDMPFLVDSLRMAITQRELNIHLIINASGIKIRRNEKNEIIEILPFKTAIADNITAEAPIYLEIDRETDPQDLNDLHEHILAILKDVKACNEDWRAMRDRLLDCIERFKTNPPPFEPTEVQEYVEFLEWLVNNHFTFLGYREYKLVGEGESLALEMISGSGLGVLRDESHSIKVRPLSFLTPSARKHVLSHDLIVLSKTNKKSTVHRPVNTDYVGIKCYDKEHNLVGEARFIGLYTSEAYHSLLSDIPLLRLKVEKVIKNSHLPAKSHAAETLRNILETLPRDDLLQGSSEELTVLAMSILQLQERRRVRLFVRRDLYHRFLSCLVYAPRDILNTELIERMQTILEKSFDAIEGSYSIYLSESILGRVHYLIRTDSKKTLHFNVKDIERKLIDVCRSWPDELRENLVEYYGEEAGNQLACKYNHAFPASYREDFIPRTAIFDIEHMEKLSKENPLGMIFYQPLDESSTTQLRFKLFRAEYPIPLSDVLPILENMGLRVIAEKPHEITLKQGCIWINDFGMTPLQNTVINVDAIQESFQEAFAKIWAKEVENDGFNRLVLSAGLTWKETTIFRAYTKYLRQTGFTFSQPYIEQAIAKHPTIAKQLIELFTVNFDPQREADRSHFPALKKALFQSLVHVISLDEDRIIRRFVDMIQATLRTNYFQTDENGQPKNYVAIKLNPRRIPEIPLPHPQFETFVYAPQFEGAHLRASKVARGGIRWSDRPEDFRVEILSLMKAQQVKNAVIVPSGAKGGFVVKSTSPDREEVVRCYKKFISALLDITDNIVDGEIISPPQVVPHDDEDPYLVVAADKGTADLSDTANDISLQYNYWLGDAFASGGRTGYDHKKMGITARGAWESVKRHFRELQINPYEDTFTVIGIGDMSGDVFGNGLLYVNTIKLVAAFNHLHIFIDPNPDPISSFAERQRLFDLPNSSWDDYNRQLISKGGAVFKRSEKSLTLSREIKTLLNLNQDTIVPSDLIRAILMAEVDLLWSGGIGTYVKAIAENNHDVGDRANDAVRINGCELRCKAVGEGGNLGFTQLGRVEYELNGGLIYTDFIDNSGGVNCSDYEVNIKILLNQVVKSGDLTEKQRNQLLAQMTEEVGQLVLKDNFYQPKAISLAAAYAVTNLELYSWYITELQQNKKIDRALEFLPNDKILLERKSLNKGLTRPELSILLAYSKITLKAEILKSSLPEDPYLSKILDLEFPTPLRERFHAQMDKHILKREIISTRLSNMITNEMGATFVDRLHDETGMSISEIVKAYAAAREIFNIKHLIQEIEHIDNILSTPVEAKMMTNLYRLMRRATRWILRHCEPDFDIQNVIEKFAPSVTDLNIRIEELLVGSEATRLKEETQELVDAQVPLSLAHKVAKTTALFPALDMVDIIKKVPEPLEKVAVIYFSLGENLELDWLRTLILMHPVENHWDALARAALRDDLDWQQKNLTLNVLKMPAEDSTLTLLSEWSLKNQMLLDRWQNMLSDLRRSQNPNFIIFFVAVRELMDLAKIDISI
jgi:glutamate dehydrogenase